jgi:hypothetical protein
MKQVYYRVAKYQEKNGSETVKTFDRLEQAEAYARYLATISDLEIFDEADPFFVYHLRREHGRAEVIRMMSQWAEDDPIESIFVDRWYMENWDDDQDNEPDESFKDIVWARSKQTPEGSK